MIFHQAGNSQASNPFNIVRYTDTVFENHFHKNLELVYVIKGSVECTLNNVSCKMKAGDFGLCLPYDIHSYLPKKDSLYWILVFSGDFVRSFSKEIAGKAGAQLIFPMREAIREYVISQLIENEEPTLYTLKSCLYGVCGEYLSSVKLLEKDKKKAEIMALIVDYVSEKHTENISLSDIADVFCYDYNYMSRCFKNIFNMSFTHFVNLYRLETATELLDQTSLSITEVALASGFQSVRNFNVFFKKNLGKTPSEYRKSNPMA